MADYYRSLPFVLKNEGGECNVKGDAGGHTNMGCTQATLDRFNAENPHLMFPTNVHDLTRDQVATIYKMGYWRFDGLNDQACATKILDMDVNDGLPSGVLLAQRAAVSLGAKIATDGHYGPGTEAALNALDPVSLMKALITVSLAHYNAVEAAHPEDEKFLAGWLHRAQEVPSA